MIVACASDRAHRGGMYETLKCQVQNAGIEFHHETIEPFSWKRLVAWELDFCQRLSGESVVFVDTEDFLFQGDAHGLQTLLSEVGHNVLYHGEAKCWPEPHKADRYPTTIPSGPYRYVNGTGPAGSTDAIAEAIVWGQKHCPIRGDEASIFADNDQRFYSDVYLSGRGKVDTVGRLSVQMNVIKEQEFEIKEGRLFLRTTDVFPLFLHFNGYSKYQYEKLREQLCESTT